MRWTMWGREAGKQFAKKAARLLEGESDPLRLERLLHFFKERDYPGDPTTILSLTKSEDGRMARAARRALKNVIDPRVRQLAIEFIRLSAWPYDGIDMLCRNYVEGDETLVHAALSRALEPDALHWCRSAVEAFFKAPRVDASARAAFSILYEKMPCSSCRHWIVKDLLELGPLPEWMIEEYRYDASLDPRRLVGA